MTELSFQYFLENWEISTIVGDYRLYLFYESKRKLLHYVYEELTGNMKWSLTLGEDCLDTKRSREIWGDNLVDEILLYISEVKEQ